MNLRVKGKGLVVLLLLALIASSCEEEENTIGFLPVENQLNLKYLEYKVPVDMIWVDSVRSGQLGAMYSGKFNFEENGIVEAIPFMSYFPQAYDSNINIPEGATITDFYLDLDYSRAINRTINSTETLKVIHLADTIEGFRSHFIQEETPQGDVIGEKTFTFTPDSLKLDQERDSIDYRLRINLDQSLGNDLFNKLVSQDSSTYYGQKEFSTAFKGLALVPGDDNTSILGFSNTTTRMVIEYTYSDNGNVKNGSFSYRVYSYYHNITPNKTEGITGTPYSDIGCCNEKYETADEFVYQLFGTGINIMFDLSAFKMFSDSLNTVQINAASLEIGNVESTSEFVKPPSNVAFYLTKEDGARISEDFNGIKLYQVLSGSQNLNPLRLGDPAVVNFNEKDKKYLIDMTLLLQHIVKNPSSPDHLILEGAQFAEYGSLKNLIRSAATISGIKIPKGSIKIKLYYSTID